jgi:threonyl-tRNA synthetase
MQEEHDQLYKMRHSAAHIMAAAVQELFDDVKLGVGPVIDNGFYYDMLLPEPLSENDLEKIEEKMREIIARDDAFDREEMSIDEAIEFFRERDQDFKVELLQDLKEKGTTKISEEELQDVGEAPDVASVYHTGDFVDLCRGPHVEHSREIGDAFKLTKLAGAYWRGSEDNPQMQRIYGVLFETQDELDAYLKRLEEAKKRDHRKLGQELELFSIVDEVGPGLPMFLPRGTQLRRQIEGLIDDLQTKRGYENIWVPHITKGKLYEMSGHLDKYDAMYPPMELDGETEYYLKPMNCPHFMKLYNEQQHSYRDLPVRWVSTTTVYRYEKSGELSGLTRVRSITQDDCHVFARPDQIEQEVNLMLDMLEEVYEVFGFDEFWVSISTRDPDDQDKYIGDESVWDEAEQSLQGLIQERGWEHQVVPGEAAFYGPKLDFMFKDAIGREWQLSTIQLDMNLPQRFELEYAASDNSVERPVVIHRAILGSVERFMGILIEHFAGAFPMWLAPEQVRLITVSEDFVDFARDWKEKLEDAGLRVHLDDSDDTVGKKIRNSANMKTPWSVVIGGNEEEGADFRVNVFGEDDDIEIAQDDFVERAQDAARRPDRR